MVITNKANLPTCFVLAAQRDEAPVPGEYRVTSLLKGIRETILETRHANEIERDAADMVWLLFGTTVHSILEQQRERDSEIKEARVKLPFAGRVLSGKPDLYDEETVTVTDYKTASVWKMIYGEFDDWRRQLLIYAYLLEHIGFHVRRGRIIAFLKDHSKRDAKIKTGYPPLPVQEISFEFSDADFAEIERFLTERIEQLKVAELLADDVLPLCTPEERYNSGDKYAVTKKGRKTAVRVLDSREAAQGYIDRGDGDGIEVRPGEDKKCADYCACNAFCSYYREHVRKETDNGDV